MAGIRDTSPWRLLYQYWLDKHVDRRPPGRRDIDPPLQIPQLVKDLMLVDVIPGEFRYRLIGSAIAEYMKVDVTGRIVAEPPWTSDSVRSDWRRLLAAVAESQKPQLIVTKFPAAVQGYNYSLVLPLVALSGTTEMLLIGIFSGGYIDPGTPIAGLTTREVTPPVNEGWA